MTRYCVYLVQDWAARSGDAARPAHSATPVRQHNLCITGRLFDSIVVTNSPPPLRCCSHPTRERDTVQWSTARHLPVSRESESTVGRGAVCGSAGRNVSREPRHCSTAPHFSVMRAARPRHQSIPAGLNTQHASVNTEEWIIRLKLLRFFNCCFDMPLLCLIFIKLRKVLNYSPLL